MGKDEFDQWAKKNDWICWGKAKAKEAFFTADAYLETRVVHDVWLTPECRVVVTYVDQSKGDARVGIIVMAGHDPAEWVQ